MESKFKKLVIWQKWIDLVKLIYKITQQFPKDEIFWLTSQIRRASISVPSNIAEWSERSNKDFSNFLRIVKWSLSEVETQLLISNELWFIKNNSDFEKSLEITLDIRKMVSWLLLKLKD
jgi:four helix bundle protein